MAGGAAGGAPIGPPVLSLTTPAAGVAVGGSMVELVGTIMTMPGREVTSATLDAGDGVSRPLTLTATSWRVMVPVPPSFEGAVTFPFSIIDRSGQTTMTSVQVLVDTRAPRVTLTTPASSTVVGASAMLSGTLTDPSTPLMTFTLTGGTAPVTPTVTGTTWTATVAFPANIDRMTRTLSFTATDSLGNMATGTFTVLVDTQPPALALLAPTPTTAAGRVATLSGSATDSSGPPMNVTIDLGAGPVPLTVTSGAWSTQATFPMNLDRVMRTVTLRGTDVVGNQATVMGTVLVDTQGPALAFTSPPAGERLGLPRMQPIAGTATDSTALVGVTLNCADAGGDRTATLAPGAWTVTWPLPTADNVSYTCVATATDSLGNVTTLARSYFVDTVAPVVVFTAPANGAVVGGPTQTMLAVTGTVSDGSAVGPMAVVFGSTTNLVTPSSGAWGTGFTLPAVDFVATPIAATATDAEGNATTIIRSVTVDRVAPVVTITAPTAGQVFNVASFPSGNAVNVTWTATDGDPTLTATLNGGAAGPTSGTITTNATDNGVPYTATVVVRDSAGNPSMSMSRTFVVDRVRPTVVSVSPANGSVRNSNRVASIVFSEPLIPSAPALNNVGSGTWSANNTRWDSASLTPATPYQAVLAAGLTDVAGNTFAAGTSWRFRTAIALPTLLFNQTSFTLATNVASFDAVSDADGQFFVAYRTVGTNAMIQTVALNAVTGGFVSNPNGLTLPAANWNTDVHVQSWSDYYPDLSLGRHRAINAAVGSTLSARASYFDGTAVDPGGLPVLTPPISTSGQYPFGVPPDGTDDFGLIIGTTYERDPITDTLLRAPRKIIPGRNYWAALSFDGTTLARAHRYCVTQSTAPFFSSCSFDFGSFGGGAQSTATVMNSVTGGVSPNGCLMYSFSTINFGRQVFAGFQETTNFGTTTPPSGTGSNFVVTARALGGHWGANSNGTIAEIWQTTNPADCSPVTLSANWTLVATVTASGATELRVVDLGDRAGVGFRHGATNELRFIYP
ncbi:MAG: Ig-like domain-containing protein [Myxococcaceae bacterium]|nr:Ig-like domain-containing protein [Myxococcaceae bacterium]